MINIYNKPDYQDPLKTNEKNSPPDLKSESLPNEEVKVIAQEIFKQQVDKYEKSILKRADKVNLYTETVISIINEPPRKFNLLQRIFGTAKRFQADKEMRLKEAKAELEFAERSLQLKINEANDYFRKFKPQEKIKESIYHSQEMGRASPTQVNEDVDIGISKESIFKENLSDKLRNGFNFDEASGSLILNEIGRKTISDQDLLGLPSIYDVQKIKNVDFQNSQLITGDGLSYLGKYCPNIEKIQLKGSKGLIELDHIKDFIKDFYVTDLHEYMSYRTIFKELEENIFQSGTQPIYFQELKNKYARTELLKFVPEGLSNFLDSPSASNHLHHCYELVIEDIRKNKLQDRSHNGSTRSTLTAEDLLITQENNTYSEPGIQTRVTNFQNDFVTLIHDKDVNEHIKSINSSYIENDLPNPAAILRDLKSDDAGKRAEAAKAAVDLKASWRDFCEKQGRFFALGDIHLICSQILNFQFPDQDKIALDMIELSNTFTQEIDEATLEWMAKKNQNYASHPTVGIIGGGPTGLFSSLKLFENGANVKVSEERDTAYVRHQIVRLDPLWVNQLKFYLGTEFEKYFGSQDETYVGSDKPRIGNRSGDGFVECVINHLETRLRDRLVTLNSFVENEHQSSGIELLAAQKVSPNFVEKDDQFFLHRTFQKKRAELKIEEVVVGKDADGIDITRKFVTGGVEKESFGIPEEEDLPVDIIFDVGGKHSVIREGNALSRDITSKAPHSVTSFFVRGDCRSYRDENHDFRRQYLINERFLRGACDTINQSIQTIIQQKTQPEQSLELNRWVTSYLERMKSDIASFGHIPVQNGQELENREKSFVYETRTFVNTDSEFKPDPNAAPRKDGGVSKLQIPDGKGGFTDSQRPDNIVYIGMEVPQPVFQFYQDLNAHLKEMGIVDEKLIKEIVDEANLGFVMSVAHDQGLDRPINEEEGAMPWVAKEYADRAFLGTFEVSQGAVVDGIQLREGQSGAKLLQICGGDNAASPHFMRYSGLSGGREHIRVLSKIVENMSKNSKFPNQRELSSASQEYNSINNFVLSRGNVFLRRLSFEEEAQNIFKEVKLLLNERNYIQNIGGQPQAYKALETSLDNAFQEMENSRKNQGLWNEIEDKKLISSLKEKAFEIISPLKDNQYVIPSKEPLIL